ncbi:MAG: nucleotidyltransferase domain-containing protein [Chloroflexales bacterium]
MLHSPDDLLADLTRRYQEAFPTQLLGLYLVGSYAVGEATPASDLDVVVVFNAPLDAAGQACFAAVRATCQQTSPLLLDCSATSLDALQRVGGVWFQTASRLIAGDDIRPLVPQKPAAAHARDLMYAVIPLIARMRGSPATLRIPLTFPDPVGPIDGYDQRTVQIGAWRQPVGTKDLVSTVLAIANALTWQTARRYVGSGRKRDIPEQYALVIGDGWTSLVEAVFFRCRGDWGYQIPAAVAELAELQGICRRALGFENHFLAIYRGFLEAEQRDSDPQVAARAAQRAAMFVDAQER